MTATHPRRPRKLAALLAAALVAAAGAVGCNDFLEATNPAQLPAERLDDPATIPLLVNAVIGEFQPSYSEAMYYSSLFSDELRNHHVFFEEPLIDQRALIAVEQDVDAATGEPRPGVGSANGTYVLFVYNPLHRARFLADSVAGRLHGFLGDTAARDMRLARVRAYSGFSYVALAENLCRTPVARGGQIFTAPLAPNELFTIAVQHFDSTIAIADAALAYARTRRAEGRAPTDSARARTDSIVRDTLVNLALVGAARASLGQGKMPDAARYAAQVRRSFAASDTASFQFRMFFSSNIATQLARLNNPFFNRFSNGSGNVSGSVTGTPFEALRGDPRVPRPAVTEGTQNAIQAFVPNAPLAFSSYDGTPVGREFERGGSMRLASYLEAQYILAEAGGAAGTNLGGLSNIAFVEGRRTAFGAGASTGTAPTTSANFLDNLIDQRRRDLFMDGHRLGDMRRYKRLYARDLYQRGAYLGSATVRYSALECMPLSTAEVTNNPLVPKS